MADLLEELAALEHERWMHWSQHVAANEDIPASLRGRWQENWRPYDVLEDDVQESDRKWARRALALLQERLEDVDGVSARLEDDQLQIRVCERV